MAYFEMRRHVVGVIGCGWAGEKHVKAYLALSNVRVKAVADIDEEKARRLGSSIGASWHRDYQQILGDPEINAVSVCLPHYLHVRVSIEAMEAGKHVLCEKPMATSLEEADAMIRSARKMGVTLMIAENVRFHSFNLKMKELIDQGLIGEVFLARIFRDHEMHDYLKSRPWFLSLKEAGGGIWISGGIHDVDALRMLIGEPEEISLFQSRKVLREMEGDDTVVAVLRFSDGALGVVTESFSTKIFRRSSPLGCPSIINGSLGTIVSTPNGLEVYSENLKSKSRSMVMRVRLKENDTFLEEIKHFIECIEHGKEPITSGEEERKTLAVICAGYESLKNGGKPVKIKY
ncbi:MAG: Gfo/Idh/MocA family oxidoreductase [Candidatus Bathyarchaeia archaeon]